MKNLQYIQDSNGNDLFVVLPIEEFEKLTGRDKYGFEYDDETDADLVPIEYEPADNDDVTIPYEVVMLELTHNVNLLGAWRLYRGLSQQEVAEKTGLTQGAISQMERQDNRPQKKTLERFAPIYGCRIEQLY